MDALGDHALACTRTGLIARRAKIVERAWVRVAREAVGPEGQVVPQQWLAHTTAPRRPTPPGPRRLRSGASRRGPMLRCHTCVAAVTHRPAAAARDGAALRVAERRKRAAYPELNGGPQQLVVLGSEVGGRWNAGAHQLLRDLVRVRAQRAPPAVRRVGQALVGHAGSVGATGRHKHALPSGQLGRRLPTRADSRRPNRNECSTLLTQQGRAVCRYAARRDLVG